MNPGIIEDSESNRIVSDGVMNRNINSNAIIAIHSSKIQSWELIECNVNWDDVINIKNDIKNKAIDSIVIVK